MSISEAELQEVIDSMDIVYTFVMDSYKSYVTTRDYGNGDSMTMVEIHTLTLIANHPGILPNEVAKMWDSTRSAATQNINKLCKKGLVTKQYEDNNKKSVHLYVTEEGHKLSDMHESFDRKQLEKMAADLLKDHTIEDLRTTVSVLKTGVNLIND